LLLALAVVTGGCEGGPAVSPAGSAAALSCRASAGQQGADPQARQVNGVESFALRGDTNAYDSLPAWDSGGRRYLIWKTYLAVSAAARLYRVVAVVSPATARLFYASPARWGAASSRRIVGTLLRRVRLRACGRRYAGYTGGILITGPACVTLAVTGPGRAAAEVTVPILISHC
jgi:hypothetical protein